MCSPKVQREAVSPLPLDWIGRGESGGQSNSILPYRPDGPNNTITVRLRIKKCGVVIPHILNTTLGQLGHWGGMQCHVGTRDHQALEWTSTQLLHNRLSHWMGVAKQHPCIPMTTNQCDLRHV